MIWHWEFYEDFADSFGAKLAPEEVNDRLIETACAYSHLEYEKYFQAHLMPEFLDETVGFAEADFNAANIDKTLRRWLDKFASKGIGISYEDIKPFAENLAFGDSLHLAVETSGGFFQFYTELSRTCKKQICQHLSFDYMPKLDVSGKPRIETGTCVKFGRYPKRLSKKLRLKDIEWLVLDNDGETALLLSKYALDCEPFHDCQLIHGKYIDVPWRDCDLRRWLNDSFAKIAFTENEFECIADSLVGHADNAESGANASEEIRDKVFCLSPEEMVKYFGGTLENKGCSEKYYSEAMKEDMPVNRQRVCKATAYAVSGGARLGGDTFGPDANIAKEWWFGNTWFWLRPSDKYPDSPSVVDFFGAVLIGELEQSDNDISVRPAIRVKL